MSEESTIVGQSNMIGVDVKLLWFSYIDRVFREKLMSEYRNNCHMNTNHVHTITCIMI